MASVHTLERFIPRSLGQKNGSHDRILRGADVGSTTLNDSSFAPNFQITGRTEWMVLVLVGLIVLLAYDMYVCC